MKLSGLEVDTPKPRPSSWQRAKGRKVGVQSREASCNKVTETKGSMFRCKKNGCVSLVFYGLPSLKQTGNAPENQWLEDDPFLSGPGLFSGDMLVTGRVNFKKKWNIYSRNL